MINKIILLVFIFLFTLKVKAQENDTIIYFPDKIIALKRKNDSVYFYNRAGELRKIIDLKNKKVTPFGLPKEVQKVIYRGKAYRYIEVLEETFPTYLYTQKYIDAGEVLCDMHIFYNELGLKTGYEEICPNDIVGGSDYHFIGKDIYKYNKYGLPTEIDNIIYKYNDNAQLIEVYYKEKSSQKIRWSRKYKYKDNRLSELISSNSYNQTIGYNYNEKGLLSEIILTKYNKIVLEYNDNNQIIKMGDEFKWKKGIIKKTFITYHYDSKHRIEQIDVYNTHVKNDSPYEVFRYKYDDNGNLIQRTIKTPHNETVDNYKYNKNGTLIYMENRWGEDKSYLKY